MTLPLDVLTKSPRLRAAYENGLPELPEIPEEIGHVLVHYLHTGRYETLRPKEKELPQKRIGELRTSIRAYAASRYYELPDLTRLTQGQIRKYGEGVALPTLLEITRDAHPNLSEADEWFLEYLKSRIRPHVQDPQALMGSGLLDRISGILSPNKILTRTVLEIMCERMAAPQIARPETPDSTKPAPPSPSPSVLQMRSRAVPRDEPSTPRRKQSTPSRQATPDAELASLTPLTKEREQEPVLPEVQPEAAPATVFEPILSEPVLAQPAAEEPVVAAPEPEKAPVNEVKLAVEPQTESSPEPVVVDATPEPVFEAQPEPVVEAKPEPEVKAEPETEKEVAPEPTQIATEPQAKEEEDLVTAPVAEKRERRDSGKGIEIEVLPVVEEEPPVLVKELESVLPTRPRFRDADSGYWGDSTPVYEPVKDKDLDNSVPSLRDVPLEPEAGKEQPKNDDKDQPVENRDQVPDVEDKADKGKETESKDEVSKTSEPLPVGLESIPEVPAELSSESDKKDVEKAEDKTAPEPRPESVLEKVEKALDKALEEMTEQPAAEREIKKEDDKVVVEVVEKKSDTTQPDKVNPDPREREADSWLLTHESRQRRRPRIRAPSPKTRQPSPPRPQRRSSLMYFPTMLSPLGPLMPRRLSPVRNNSSSSGSTIRTRSRSPLGSPRNSLRLRSPSPRSSPSSRATSPLRSRSRRLANSLRRNSSKNKAPKPTSPSLPLPHPPNPVAHRRGREVAGRNAF